MKQFAITSERFAGQILFKYHSNGYLTSFEIDGDLNQVQLCYFYKNLPRTEAELRQLAKAPGATMTLVEVPMDLTFEKFWDAYHYKIGKMARAKKLWAVMNDAEKTACLLSIRKYDAFLAKTNHARQYPETFLSQRTWEGDFR